MKNKKFGIVALSLLSLSLIACGNKESATEPKDDHKISDKIDTDSTGKSDTTSESIITEDEMTGGIVMTLDSTGSYYIVTDYLSVEYDIVIPDVYQGKPVREIGEAAFRYATIDTLVLPHSLRKIGKEAFLGLDSDSKLTELTLPEGIEELDDGAFQYCPTLTTISLPKSLKKLGRGVFHLDFNIKKIKVDSGSESFLAENNVLYSKDKKTLYVYPAGLKFTSYDLPNEVETIADYAFYGNSVLTAISISKDSNLKHLGYRSVAAVSALTSLSLEKATHLTEVEDLALSENKAMVKVTLPESLTTLSKGLFHADSSLISVNIKGTYTEIPDECFESCSKLTNITINSAVTRIGYRAFSSCVNLTSLSLPNAITEIGDEAFTACTSLKAINIPTSLTKISAKTFANCRGITSIDLGSNITELGASAFNGCTSLSTLDLSKTKITVIPETCFMSCSALKTITLPDTLTEIGQSAFNSCSELRRVLLPNKVTTIKDSAFFSCSKLAYVYLPKSVKSIGTVAFRTTYATTGTVNLYFEADSFTNENTEAGDNFTNGTLYFSKTISDYETDSAGSLA